MSAPATPSGTRLSAIAGLLLASVIFGGTMVMGRHGVQAGLSAWDLVFLRFAVSGLVLLPVLLWHQRAALRALGWRRAIVLTLLSGASYQLWFNAGLHWAPASHAALFNPGSALICATVAGWLLLREPIPRRRRYAIPIILAGLLLIAWRGLTDGQGGPDLLLGDLLLASSGLSWGLFTVLLRYWRVGSLLATATFSALSLPYVAYYALDRADLLAQIPWQEALAQAGYQGLLSGVFAYLLYARAVTVLGPSVVALSLPLVPVFGILLAIPLLDEWPDAIRAVGMVVVLGGMVLAALRPRARHEAALASPR